MQIVTSSAVDQDEWAKAQGKVLIGAVSRLGESICRECNGYGHWKQLCPTYARIQKITKGFPLMKSCMNRARETDVPVNVGSILGKRKRVDIPLAPSGIKPYQTTPSRSTAFQPSD